MKKVVITGAAGLVGQNLIPLLKREPGLQIVAIDKHPTNTGTLRRLHPDIRVVHADLAEPGPWEDELGGASQLVSGHAQIGGLFAEEFVRNNVHATERLLEAAKRAGVGYVVSISSSVVNSMAHDNYTETKKAQEKLTLESGLKQVVLRPTLMFGWFDRKHLGWLARFMQKVPIFPVPGSGKYLRQPLYGGDFSAVIASALRSEITGTYNITGQERIDYIDLIREVKRATGAKATIIKVPYAMFWAMLKAASLVNNNPAFTTTQLKALVTPDVFEVIDWPSVFDVRATPLREALERSYRDPEYSGVVLDF